MLVRLRDGHSIHTVSALLLQLVQTSTRDVRVRAQRLTSEREQSFVLSHQQDSQEERPQASVPATERDFGEIQLYVGGMDPATKAARTIINFLTKRSVGDLPRSDSRLTRFRSGKGKAAKSSNDAEYRTILDNLIADLLTVLHWPEWPAASLVLNIISRFMVGHAVFTLMSVFMLSRYRAWTTTRPQPKPTLSNLSL